MRIRIIGGGLAGPEAALTASRLGCQVRLRPALDGLTVRVPRSTLLGG